MISYAQKMSAASTRSLTSTESILRMARCLKCSTLGQTQGVFQFESGDAPGADAAPARVDGGFDRGDLFTAPARWTPSPLYIRNRHNPAPCHLQTPAAQAHSDVTYGCIVYQEQVMHLPPVGWILLRPADLVRRASVQEKGGCDGEGTAELCPWRPKEDGSVECAVANGVSEEIANSIFDEMSGFGLLRLNKSHAAALCLLLAYQTALKCYYPKEFLALLTSVLDNTDKVIEYINEYYWAFRCCPSIQESDEGFTVTEEGIRFGLWR